jgi:hypothetical protein
VKELDGTHLDLGFVEARGCEEIDRHLRRDKEEKGTEGGVGGTWEKSLAGSQRRSALAMRMREESIWRDGEKRLKGLSFVTTEEGGNGYWESMSKRLLWTEELEFAQSSCCHWTMRQNHP